VIKLHLFTLFFINYWTVIILNLVLIFYLF